MVYSQKLPKKMKNHVELCLSKMMDGREEETENTILETNFYPSSTVTRQTKCLSPLDTKGIGGIWAHFGRVSRREGGCLESLEEVPALEPQGIALVWPSVLFVDKGRRFLKKNVQA
ncbi:hypothetical protein IB49_15350 [Geobacillus sp. LC300]|nr:hypothetical protein IB49_15350 [Geobacillus sp. LC300]